VNCLQQLTLLGRNSASRNSHALIGLRIVKRVDFFQFTVADMHAIEDLIHAKDCLHFKDCGDKISLDNILLDLDAFDGWQNTRQESDHSVPPDQLSYALPSKVIFAAKGILDISLPAKPLRYASTTATFSSRDTLSPEFAEMPKAAQRRQHWLPKLDHNSLLDAEPPTAGERRTR
jgi:hypothetical protein